MDTYVQCVDNEGCEGHLTVGKQYKVLSEDTCYYRVMRDEGYEGGYWKHRFETVAVVTETPASDNIDPSHYTKFDIQPMDFLLAAGPMGAHVAHSVPYLMRAGDKIYPDMTKEQSEAEDLKKVIRWVQGRIDYLQQKEAA